MNAVAAPILYYRGQTTSIWRFASADAQTHFKMPAQMEYWMPVSRLRTFPLSGYPGLATRNSAVDNFIAERRAEAAQGCGLNMTPIVFVASATLARYVVQLAMG